MKTETLNLETSRGKTTAHVALPETDTAAAVLLIHEWWGINDHMRDIAGRFANEGYLCIAPDLFRGKTASNTEEASKLMNGLAIEDGIETINEAISEAKIKYQAQKFGVIGFCMGGTFALRAACDIDEIAAAAPFYGDIPPEDVLKNLKAPTLFIAGSKDAWINAEKVNALKAAAKKHDLPVETIVYEADHAFFNNTRPEVYDADAAADAWRRVLELFRKHLAVAVPTGA